MAGRRHLANWEIGMIRRLLLDGSMNNQRILSYFTRPGRDLNHRIVAEIAQSATTAGATLPLPASPADRDHFLALRESLDSQHFRIVESMLLSASTSLYHFGWLCCTNGRKGIHLANPA